MPPKGKTMMSDVDKSRRRMGRVRFERFASQIVFDPASSVFVVTWAKCNLPLEARLAKRAPENWLPSISAMVTLYDRGCVKPEHVVYAAKAVGAAWKAGDRDGLDTESAKKAAELVCDLSSMCVDTGSSSVACDIGQAMRHLLDEMAAVKFMNEPISAFEQCKVMPALEKAASECLAIEGFIRWPSIAKRRRFMYCLNRKERTEVAYTLTALLFDTGACSLLSLTDRRKLRMQAARASEIDIRFCLASVFTFLDFSLRKMRQMRASDTPHVSGDMSANELIMLNINKASSYKTDA